MVPLLANPISGDDLLLYLAASNTVVSSTLVKEEKGIQRSIYYTSKAMVGTKIRYSQVEKLVHASIVLGKEATSLFSSI